MCGRYTLTMPINSMRELFGFDAQPNLAARYNVAPGQDVPAVRLSESCENQCLELDVAKQTSSRERQKKNPRAGKVRKKTLPDLHKGFFSDFPGAGCFGPTFPGAGIFLLTFPAQRVLV